MTNAGKDIEDAESGGEDDGGFDFDKYGSNQKNEGAKFSDIKGPIRGDIFAGEQTVALNFDNFEDLIGEREQK